MRANEIAEELGDRLVSTRTLAGGFSHETVLLELADRRVVARFGGGDSAAEARVMEAAAPHVPVPSILLVRPGVMVIEFVEGTPLSEVLERGGAGAAMRGLGEAGGRTAGAVSAATFSSSQEEPPWSEQLPAVAESCMSRTERLDPDTRAAWIELCAEHAPALRAVADQRRLVHAELNPKNILVSGGAVTALLDWEFSFSGPPATDAGNMARFAADYPDGFLDGFEDGFGATAADLPEDWRYVGWVLDMFALSDLCTRPPGNPVADAAAGLIREWTRDGNPHAAHRKRA